MRRNFDVVIVGGGTGGIAVAARLRSKLKNASVAIIEPSDKHYYQPLWTLVGGGDATLASTERNEADLIPAGVTWIRDTANGFQPENNIVFTKDAGEISYKYLVVAAGIQINWDKIAGLTETIGKNAVVSNYDRRYVEKTWEYLDRFAGGTAVFTFPDTPIKCGGAPQKIMYLAEHLFRKKGIRSAARVIFATAGDKIFAVPRYADALTKICKDRGIEVQFGLNLERVDGHGRTAFFRDVKSGNLQELAFDFLHVTPPMSAPDFIKQSPLAASTGWVEVDKSTLRHVRFNNVFALGDASNLPTSKTGAAIRKQAPVLVEHLSAQFHGKTSDASYDGYTSCPLVTGYGRLILAEFDYNGTPAESFPFDQSKERRSMYLLKKYGLPMMYWHGMMKGIL